MSRQQERGRAGHRLGAQGLSITAIADQLPCGPKTVRQDIAAARPRGGESPWRRPNRFGLIVWKINDWVNSGRDSVRRPHSGTWPRDTTTRNPWPPCPAGCAHAVACPVKRGRRPVTPANPTTAEPGPGFIDRLAQKPWTGRQGAHGLGMGWPQPQLPRRAANVLSQRLAHDPLYQKAWTLTHDFHTLVAHCRANRR